MLQKEVKLYLEAFLLVIADGGSIFPLEPQFPAFYQDNKSKAEPFENCIIALQWNSSSYPSILGQNY